VANFLIVLVVIVIMAVMTPAAQPLAKYCVQDQQQEDRMRAIMSDSLDQAFKQHIVHLFDIWVKDQAEEPIHAVNGAQLGISAYVRSQRSLQKWKPQRC
jgi:hypothetical protein